ncbi:MAG: prepilin peptidase [Campylobacterales bacterium]
MFSEWPLWFWFVIGLLFGSFSNVLIARLPKGESIISPASHCPSCGHPVRWYHNIPLVSWIWLRGRCADCHAPISWRYPLVELVGGILMVLAAWKGGSVVGIAVTGVLFIFLVALAIIDWETKMVPDLLSIPALFLAWLTHPIAHVEDMLLLIGCASLLRFLLSALLQREAMGEGDIIILGIMGALVGWKLALAALFIGSLIALPIALMRRAIDPETPFVPFLVAGLWLVWLLDKPVLKLIGQLYG